MASSSGGALANDCRPELFGPPRRRPLLSNTVRTLFKIYAKFPEENHFTQFADSSHTPAVWRACNAPQQLCLRPSSGDDSTTRREIEASAPLDDSSNLEVGILPTHNETNNGGTAEVLCKDSGLNRSEMTVDELSGGKEHEKVDVMVSNEINTTDYMVEAHNVSQDLVDMESILMGESDDLGMFQLSDKDVNFDILKDFSTLMDTVSVSNEDVLVESSGNEKLLVEGKGKEDVVVKSKGKDKEAKKSTSVDNARQSQDYGSSNKEQSSCAETGDQFVGAPPQDARKKDNASQSQDYVSSNKEQSSCTCTGDQFVGTPPQDSRKKENARQSQDYVSSNKEQSSCIQTSDKFVGTPLQDATKNETKVYKRKRDQGLSEIGALILSAKRSKSDRVSISGIKVIDSVGKDQQPGDADKGKIEKSKKADANEGKREKSNKADADKGKREKSKKVDADKGKREKNKKADADKSKKEKSKKGAIKHVKSGKKKQLSVDIEGYNSTKSARVDPVYGTTAMKDVKSGKSTKLSVENEDSTGTKCSRVDLVVDKKMLEQTVHRVCEGGPSNRRKLLYTREQLMHLRKLAAAPEVMLKTVEEISLLLQRTEQNPTVENAMDVSVCDKGQLGMSAEDKCAEVKMSGIKVKKKRGPSSEAKKEKKKQKRRKKRAEMNKKLGVKRLKLRPILKPKVVPHCRHYLKGRCHEGEKCKFSHDVIPLTKSKPCCHFARHTCMKGDDCPFDHQLSNYPCNNYVETGVCSRGEACLFSHKIAAKGISEMTLDSSKGEVRSLDRLDKSNSIQHVNASSSVVTTQKNPKENLAAPFIHPSKAPKGLSFLSFGRTSLDNSAMHEADGSLPNAEVARTSGQPNPAISVNQGKTLMSVPASPTPQRVSTFPPEKSSGDSSATNFDPSSSASQALPGVNFVSLDRISVDSFTTNNQANVDVAGTGGQLNPPGKAVESGMTLMGTPTSPTPKKVSFPSLEKSSADNVGNKNQASLAPYVDFSSFPSFCNPPMHESIDCGQSADQLNERISGKNLSSSETFKSIQCPLTPKVTDFPSLTGPSVDGSGHKFQAGPSYGGHSGSQIENRVGYESEHFKVVHSEPQGSSAPGQLLTKTGGSVKRAPGTAQRALLSTLAFAAKFESGIKMSSAATSEIKKNEGISGSGCKQKEPIKPSAILELLYGGSRKEKQ